MKFSYIICYRHDTERYKNLVKVLDWISHFDCEVILIEQDKEPKLDVSSLSQITNYIFTYSSRPFNRSWAFNVGAKYSRTNILAFGDCDLIIPTEQINETIRVIEHENISCVSPYETVIDLAQNESATVDLTKWGNIVRNGRGGTNITGGVVFFKKEDFYKISGWCEEFEGWGGEDDFMTWKVKNWLSSKVVNGNVYHLFHTRPVLDQEQYRKNVTLLRSVNSTDKQQVVNWINGSRATIGLKDKYMDYEFASFLKGKRVCLVGPAPHMKDSNYGDLIDSYDVVVRVNRALPIMNNRKKDLGTKTDILYNCLNPEPDSGGFVDPVLIKRNVGWLAMPYPEIFPFNKDIINFRNRLAQVGMELNLHIFNMEQYNNIEKKIGTRPNTGVLAMVDLLNYDISELYVTGFTFFRGGYDLDYRNIIEGKPTKTQKESEDAVMDRMNRAGNHSQEPQINLIKELFKNNDKFKGDNEFKKIMNE